VVKINLLVQRRQAKFYHHDEKYTGNSEQWRCELEKCICSKKNGDASRKNAFVRKKNGDASWKNAFVSKKNGDASRKNAFASKKNGDASRKNTFAVRKMHL
jgi:hypothetical protein